jgi:hypothetical protein
MGDIRRGVAVGVLIGCSVVPGLAQGRRAAKQERKAEAAQKEEASRVAERGHAVLWQDPGAIARVDLLHGPGGRNGKPEPPFTFDLEEPGKKTTKVDVHDGKGRKWSVEVGKDARPEVAVSRLLWAVGYLPDVDYVVWKAHVDGLQMRNAKRYLHHDAKPRTVAAERFRSAAEDLPYLQDVRFASMPAGEKKLGIWHWKQNAFSGTRELNGLRVMMALLNCWDLPDEKNVITLDAPSGREVFRESGFAASLGRAKSRSPRKAPDDDLRAYARSRFITRKTGTTVDFATPSRGFSVLSLFSRRSSAGWVGRGIPRDDARWMGSLLGQLSHKQIEDAFWAAGYSAAEVNVYANVVDARIHALSDL